MRAHFVPGHPRRRLSRRDRVGNTGRAATRKWSRPKKLPPLEQLLREVAAA